MVSALPEHSPEIRVALREVVDDCGPDALSQPALMANLLADLLPDAPRVVRMLVAAAENHIAGALLDYSSQGMDSATAATLAGSSFAAATLFAPDACAWAVAEFAVALGLMSDVEEPVAALRVPTTPALSAKRRQKPQPGPAADRPTVTAVADSAARRQTALRGYIAYRDVGTLSPVNLVSGTTGTPIKVGKWPLALAITPDLAMAYVVNNGRGTITPINLSSGTAGRPIRVGKGPTAIAVTPDGASAYVTNHGDGTVTPINLADHTTRIPINVGKLPLALAITPDGTRAYVANHGDGTITPVNLATGKAGTPIRVGKWPLAIAITPDGTTAYVASHTDFTVTPINLADHTTLTPISVGKWPWALAITPDGTMAYIANHQSGTVTPVNLAARAACTPIKVGKDPAAIAITPDGTIAYVLNHGDGTLTPIDLTARTADTPLEVGRGPTAIAVIPEGNPATNSVTPRTRQLLELRRSKQDARAERQELMAQALRDPRAAHPASPLRRANATARAIWRGQRDR